MKSIILYNIPGDASPRDQIRIAERLKLVPVLGSLKGELFAADNGHLYTTARKITTKDLVGPLSYVAFITAAIEFNNALPMTPWMSGSPPCIGEWNASSHHIKASRRWWNGKWWSMAYYATDADEVKQESRLRRSDYKVEGIKWRGLIEQPITAGLLK